MAGARPSVLTPVHGWAAALRSRASGLPDLGTIVGLAVVCATAVVALGPHVIDGGFHADDWLDAGRHRFHPGAGFWAAVNFHQNAHFRDSWAVLRTVLFDVFGMHSARHLALTSLAAAVEAGLLLLVARRLGSPAGPATGLALLVLLFPQADSLRLWATGLQPALFAGCFLLGGLLVALSGLRLRGWRAGAVHALALLLYAVSVNGYELGAPLIALFGLLYLRSAPRRAAVWRWAADLVVVAAVLWHYAVNRAAETPSLHDLLSHARLIGDHGLHVAAKALVPVRGASTLVVLVAASVLVLSAAPAATRARPGSRLGGELRRGLLITGAGVLAAAVGWLMIIPGDLGYDPRAPGVGNRINAVAAIGLAVAVVGIAVLVAAWVRVALRTRAPSLSLLVTVLLMPIVAGYLLELRSDVRDWDRAAAENRYLLDRLRVTVPAPAPATTMFTFGVSGYSAPSVLIFGGGGNNDLVWAARLLYDKRNVSAFPVLGGMTLRCNQKTMSLDGTGEPSATRYGRALLVDIPKQQVMVPADRAACVRDTGALMPYAPVNETEG